MVSHNWICVPQTLKPSSPQTLEPSNPLPIPIEIKDLHIKAVINQGGQKGQPRPASPPAGSGGDAPDKGDIVAECVEKVLEILKKKNER